MGQIYPSIRNIQHIKFLFNVDQACKTCRKTLNSFTFKITTQQNNAMERKCGQSSGEGAVFMTKEKKLLKATKS